MGSISGEEPKQWDAQGLTDHDERILVSVRLRPLNEKEIAKNDVSDWECINSNTIIFKNTLPERSMFPTAYTFDRVFGCDSSTKQVYEEAAKEVALSVVNGINSSIFAYGPTSSGKTYTMSGITEFTIADIYDYMQRHDDREFILKFSAMEIYNESVRDLLSTDGTPLRVLDDPERGTVVEKLTEEVLMDWTHLNELLAICEAQRHIGETSLNEMSSRSHQILRLTIESSARDFLVAGNSSTLTAAVSFIDLAGSERASQTSSAGTRLKEGCHINRSLLTLGTVIRKLSKGRNGHVPYRDSKLTRILQNSLGGNARTAIICTMSPARSHVEQSRNTLLFASCAKEVSTNAQVTVVMSDKALVKRLQKELARLEGELRSLGSTAVTSNSTAILKEKEILIGKMDKEIKELKQQRDLAESRVQDLLESVRELQVSRAQAEPDQHLKPHAPIDSYAYTASESSKVVDPLCSDATPRIFDRIFNSNKDSIQLTEFSEDNFMPDSITPQVFLNKFFGPDPCRGWETMAQKTELESEGQCKEVRCIEMEETGTDKNIIPDAISSPLKGDKDLNSFDSEGTYKVLKQKIQDMKKTVDCLASPDLEEHSSCSSGSGSRRSVNLCRSRSCRAILMSIPSPSWFGEAEENENISPNFVDKDFRGRPKEPKHSELRFGSNNDQLCRNDSQTSVRSASTDEKEQDIKISGDDDVCSVQNRATEPDEAVKSKSLKEPGDDMNEEAEQESNKTGQKIKDGGLEIAQGPLPSPSSWPLEFERQRREIIELWESCNVPLVHRSCFFLLFKGDPSESVYMEVELRRLSFIKNNSSQGTRSLKHGDTTMPESSKRALNREREFLIKQVSKRYSTKEREALYEKWNIDLNSKRRRQQLVSKLWTDTEDMEHIKESANLVSELVGVGESGQTAKELVGLSFTPISMNARSFSWRPSKSPLI